MIPALYRKSFSCSSSYIARASTYSSMDMCKSASEKRVPNGRRVKHSVSKWNETLLQNQTYIEGLKEMLDMDLKEDKETKARLSITHMELLQQNHTWIENMKESLDKTPANRRFFDSIEASNSDLCADNNVTEQEGTVIRQTMTCVHYVWLFSLCMYYIPLILKM